MSENGSRHFLTYLFCVALLVVETFQSTAFSTPMVRNRLLRRAILYRDRGGSAETSIRKRFKSKHPIEDRLSVFERIMRHAQLVMWRDEIYRATLVVANIFRRPMIQFY
jgi:hypothetical protein